MTARPIPPGRPRPRRAWYGGNAAALTLFTLAILVLLMAFSARHHTRWDVTENRRHSLSDQSLKVLGELTGDVEVLAFVKDDGSREPVRDLLEQYTYPTDRFSYTFVDPDRQPGLAREHDVAMYGTVVVSAGGRSEKITQLTEEELTNALVRATSAEKKTVCFLTGHGERGIEDAEPAGYSRIREAVERANYEVEELLLMRAEAVPENCRVLVAASPRMPLLDPEKALLRAYIERGGKLFFLLDPEAPADYAELLAEYGFRLGNDVVIDKLSRMFGAEYTMPVITEYGSHPIVRNFNLATFFAIARSVRPAEPAPAGISVEALASSGADSWAETDLATLRDRQEAVFDEAADLAGPVPLASVAVVNRAAAEAAAEAGAGEPPAEDEPGRSARIVVFGDADFADNSYLDVSGNRDLFLNSVSWLAEEESLISIRPRDPDSAPLLLTPAQTQVAFWLPVIIVPGLAAAAGVRMIVRRRRHA